MADEDRWLTAAELDTWRAYLVSRAHLMRVLDQQLQRDSGISHTDYALLTRLSDRGSATMNELAEMLEHAQSRTNHEVVRLQRRPADGVRALDRCRAGRPGGGCAGTRPLRA